MSNLKLVKGFLFGMMAMVSVPVWGDIQGTVLLPDGTTPEKVTISVFEHYSDSSSGFKGNMYFEGNQVVIPTKSNKAYRFQIRGEKNGIEYYQEFSKIPWDSQNEFALQKVYPIEVAIVDSAGNTLEAYTRTSWDKGFRGFNAVSIENLYTVYQTQFKPETHVFMIQTDGYKDVNVRVPVTGYRTPVKVVLEPLQAGYTLTGKIRYEDGTPVEQTHFFEQGLDLHADVYRGRLYFKSTYGGPKLATVLPTWDDQGNFKIPNLLEGTYFTDVVFEKEGQAYAISQQVTMNGNKTEDLVARKVNALKVNVKDEQGNLVNKALVALKQEGEREDGTTLNRGTYTEGDHPVVYHSLLQGEAFLTVEMDGYEKIEEKIEIKEGMNSIDIILK